MSEIQAKYYNVGKGLLLTPIEFLRLPSAKGGWLS